MNPIYDIGRHWQSSSVCAVEYTAGLQTEKIIIALMISSWPKCQSSHHSCVHAVVVTLMSLHIFAEVISAMSIVVDSLSRHDDLRADRFRYAVVLWERVEPKDTEAHHDLDH